MNIDGLIWLDEFLEKLETKHGVYPEMAKPLPTEQASLPGEFDSLAEAGAFWDTHSTADYEDVMENVSFEVSLARQLTYYVAIAKNIVTELQTVAHQQGISTQTLINLWLQEKLMRMTNWSAAVLPFLLKASSLQVCAAYAAGLYSYQSSQGLLHIACSCQDGPYAKYRCNARTRDGQRLAPFSPGLA